MARLWIFAGPNGSGKSTLNEHLRGEFNYGFYINADDIKKKMDAGQGIALSDYNLSLTNIEFSTFISNSSHFKKLKI